ncbi:glutathione S-transferase kappa 1 [Eurytemora carolleeae]|uniref:glutathione S-transferase kappa 1 n=1 Tax=Eurytemora carolleeae TaxID=1294199 RepID=UPI000C75C0FE|nr:glutathione S-transferase kappa 1 [Eurytemora carolleeae]|eukprot:XP_023344334.1 glutathione S-transferase kappa 1-like [Eurytemora affinis]
MFLRRFSDPVSVITYCIKKFSTESGNRQVAKLKLDIYFDTISPYSWPAFEVISRYKSRWNLDITWKPVFMGGLTVAAGNSYIESMTGCPNKASYTFKDLETRTGRYFEIPLKMKSDPISHIGIIGSLSQQRFVTAVQQEYPELLENICREIWTRSWGPEDLSSHTQEDLNIIATRAGLSADQIKTCFEKQKSPVVKQTLKDITEEAVERGAFGSPTLFFMQGDKEEMFWGSDRFDMIASIYGLEWAGPNPAKL